MPYAALTASASSAIERVQRYPYPVNLNETSDVQAYLQRLVQSMQLDSEMRPSDFSQFCGLQYATIESWAAQYTLVGHAHAAGDITTGTLAVARGGTNIGSYTIGDLICASAATTLSSLADVAAGAYLRSGGVATAPLWSTLTLPNAATAYRLPVATSTNTIGELAAVGATGEYLAGATGAIPAWATLAPVGTWTPVPTGLTVVGTPTYTGTYVKIGDTVFISLRVYSTTTTASAGAGTTYFSGLPFVPARYALVAAVNGVFVDVGNGFIATNSILYCPAWAATQYVYINGFYFTA
jgi:hypothetical protein